MNEEKYIDLIKKQYENVDKANTEIFNLWYENSFLGWEWWVNLLLTFLPWIIWLKLRPKDSADRLLYIGFLVMIITCGLDFIGIALGLWVYIHKLVPIIPTFAPYDFSILPVIVMLLLQYKPHVSPYIKAFLFAIIGSFIGEPFFKWIDFYEEIKWNSFFSFPIYFLIFLIAYYVSKRNGFSPFNNTKGK
ncbi:CBO0543 family protein [Metabacillus litoralis]|uniref:Uncharacterized protein n=1 Tax=Metabacillus litoralis TaxID=152268 RepID=A0A179T1A3_9BACI|nr:CBO0543 family protein [Metabacillus litoralis]OAS87757.1 hypothetical protein A6K24_18630 [Metabacillus litoralis]